ncbi:MAG: glucosamine-6-phosphate isomerase [Actinobacteria bacterium]|nr:glucosamine-6-phosphate isomerase [Actinomycetota bacterium]MBM3712163.1 glucosamine-6-phosphate isomerase [Actinomycetota bacterium]
MDYHKIDEETILQNSKIKVYLVDTDIDIYNDMARVMVNKIKENNEKNLITSFIFPVGPMGQYERFARICNLEKISCKNVVSINMDEYLDDNDEYIPMSHDLSFRNFMKVNLFDLLDSAKKIKPENIYFPDPKNTGELFKVISELKGVDICFGGIGINGHIAFNEPMSPDLISVDDFKQLKTRVLNIDTVTKVQNNIDRGGHMEHYPKRCVTIGMKEIFMSKELRFYLEWNVQSAVLRKAVFMEPTPAFPSSYLKTHPRSSITVSKNVLKQYIK